jgi:hypothetical protein
MCTLGILYSAKLFSTGQEYGMDKSIFTFLLKKPPILLFPKTGIFFAGKPQFAQKNK